VHRIGRTGRAGRLGKSFTLVTDDDAKAIAAIERLTKREIPVLEMSGAAAEPSEREPANDDEARPRGRGRGRKSASERGERSERSERQERGDRRRREAKPDRGEERARQPRTNREPGEQRRGGHRTEHPADIPGPLGFEEDNTPAFLLRPTRKEAASA